VNRIPLLTSASAARRSAARLRTRVRRCAVVLALFGPLLKAQWLGRDLVIECVLVRADGGQETTDVAGEQTLPDAPAWLLREVYDSARQITMQGTP
jgi:hypothetical protein